MLATFAQWLVDAVQDIGYPGLFLAIGLGNMLVPVPVEAVMIPAGYLVQQGNMSLAGVLLSSIAGDICGSLVSYYVAYHFGRKFLYTFGRYFFFGPNKIEMLDKFFAGHGEVSVLTGRLVPGLRHFMAFPAGLSHMNAKKFVAYTGIGGGLWIGVLVWVGYLIGGNKALVRHYMPYVEGAAIIGVIVMIVWYVRRHRRKMKEGGHV